MNLQTLTDELRSGNNQCLEIIFKSHGKACVDLYKSKGGCSTEDAEDVLIESVMAFRENLIEGKAAYLTNVRSYLFSIGMNICRARRRQRNREEERKPDVLQYFYDYLDNGSQDEGECRDEMIAVSEKAMESLGEKCREILTLFYLESKSMKQIAEKMGFSGSAVAKTTKSRCFKKLMQAVENILKPETNLME